MAQNKERERNAYVEQNHLQDSYINKVYLYQYRNVLPQRKYVGRTEEYYLFFEETEHSLRKRSYGVSDSVTSWNLLFSNGKKSEKVTKDFLSNNVVYSNNYTKDNLIFFLDNNRRNVNALEQRKTDKKTRSIFVTDDEYEIIKSFIEKMRGKNENN